MLVGAALLGRGSNRSRSSTPARLLLLEARVLPDSQPVLLRSDARRQR